MNAKEAARISKKTKDKLEEERKNKLNEEDELQKKRAIKDFAPRLKEIHKDIEKEVLDPNGGNEIRVGLPDNHYLADKLKKELIKEEYKVEVHYPQYSSGEELAGPMWDCVLVVKW